MIVAFVHRGPASGNGQRSRFLRRKRCTARFAPRGSRGFARTTSSRGARVSAQTNTLIKGLVAGITNLILAFSLFDIGRGAAAEELGSCLLRNLAW